MDGKQPTTLQFSTWNDYRHFVDELSDNWVFRGQAAAEWGLVNAIERTDFIQHYKGIEADFLSEFQRGARNYLNKDEIPEHLIEWLALMQHHGAPTRLLDFTRSPYIAAYFAFEQYGVAVNDFMSIWAVNINFLRTRAIAKLKEHYGPELEASRGVINEALFEKIFYDNSCSLVFPVEPFRMNRRYSLQQSIFVSTGTSYEPFIQQLDFLGDEIEKSVIKIEMPAELQKPVLRDLQKMNINRASLFPDLDGYALSLKLRYNSLKTSEEMLAHQLQKAGDEHFRFIP
ncbi:MAG TPA: FRG domain-containing protein [Chitinophagaceae bacterium]